MKSILTISILALTLSVHGQSKIDLTYFTLGLVNDYLGRELILTDSLELRKVDQYHETEIDIFNYLDSLVIIENSFRDKNSHIDRKMAIDSGCGNCHEFIIYYSKRLADELNDKYRFSFTKTWDDKDRKIYSGRIKRTAINTREQRQSFLAGAYLRYGQREGEIYKFSFANSASKFRMVRKSLKRTHCEIVSIKTIKNQLPSNQRIEFIPTKELKAEFDRLDLIKERVDLKKKTMFTK